MFTKLVAIEPIHLVPLAQERLRDCAEQLVLYDDVPRDDWEIIHRIGDADGVLLSYTSSIGKTVIQACPNIRYIGMCCSLYSPESANVDIGTATEKGIVVRGVRDYGDPGVAEYVLSELIRYLHGFGDKQWKAMAVELTDLKVGIVGLGTTGQLIAGALSAMGSDLYYYSRTRKPDQEAKGVKYLPLDQLLPTVDVVCCCLNKNVVLLREPEFAQLGHHKMLFNISIGPSHDVAALTTWLAHGDNEFFCDSASALGDEARTLLAHPHVNCMHRAAGITQQSLDRLGEKVLANIAAFLGSS